jgi:uncharacterized membrane protein YhiD involved in acid resistance
LMHISKRSFETVTRVWLLILTVASIAPLYAQGAAQPAAPQPATPTVQQQPSSPPQTMLENINDEHRQSLGSWEIDLHAFVALPLATALGAALAMRPRRKGTPKRSAPVVQTQIILAVIGTSLARAFGVVGAAGLVRYRAKIDDPKDAGVMLTTLAVGLGAGIGVYGLAVFATIFLIGLLWVIESFEPSARKEFILEIKAKEVAKLQPKIEAVLRRRRVKYEIREAAPEELSYFVQMPMDVKTDGISAEVMAIDPDPGTSVEWKTEKKKAA